MTRGKQIARGGFTLIEVLIVIAIILALTGIVAVTLFSRKDQAKIDLCKIEINEIGRAMDMFRLDFERWPSEAEGLAILWNKETLDPEVDQAKWKGYLSKPRPNDPWGQPWGYRPETEQEGREGKYDLWSFGPDKEEGTEDDINNWSDEVDDGSGGMGGDLPPPPPPSGG